VLVTGCSSGIGKATARRLVERGGLVFASARKLEAIEDLATLGCRTIALDVTSEASMRDAVAAVEREAGAVGVLVNNAGYSLSGAVETVSLAQASAQFEVNLWGVARLCQLVLPGMRRQRFGRIVNVSSMGGKLTFPGGGFYHASKHAVEALSDALRYEVAGFGVDVIVVEPGIIRTGFAAAALAQMPSQVDEVYAEFNGAVARATREVYEHGLLARLGADPAAVARVIERAIGARRPKARYRVDLAGRILLAQRALLPDRVWDAFLRRSFPTPG
jgi:NAD(P)-dependent dehydrogenase (short-subunit alcohol dehydrogenase family)